MSRSDAYTTVRHDVCDLVPPSALGILDVGCSSGALGACLKAANPARHVCGIELDAEFADEAAKRLDRVIHADVECFDWRSFGRQRFDCVVLADVLEHVRQPERVLAEALTLVRPGGHAIVSLPNIRHVSALWAIAMNGSFPRRDRGIFDATHLRWFTVADGRSLLQRQGLALEAESFALRLGDKGGGRANRAFRKFAGPFASFAPIREFFAYQFCIRARKPA